MADGLTIGSILQIGGLSGITAAAAKWAIDAFWVERRKNQSDALYAAIRTTVILERYVQQSEAHMSDREVEHERMGRLNDVGELPSLDPFPPDVNWRAFDTELTFKVLSFPGRIAGAQAACERAAAESQNYYDSGDEAKKLGLGAWEIALAIRSRYKLGANDKVRAMLPLLSDRRMELARRAGEAMARWKENRAADPGAIDQAAGDSSDVR
ncbi:hypothetical protein [Bosea sp. LjRoot237]|uniref:hypothetical protein n=1 Tax=Bosea sp. LjRoot237 TaxID=3342292 RepID=UPI003ECCCEE3